MHFSGHGWIDRSTRRYYLLPHDVEPFDMPGSALAVFASSRGEQRAWLRPDRTLSFYTHHLLEALRGAGSRPGDDVVRLSHLAAHLSRTVPDSARRLCAAEQTPFYDWSTEDFPVALLRGGKGLPVEGWQVDDDLARPAAATYSAILTSSGAIAQDDSVAAGAGGTALEGSAMPEEPRSVILNGSNTQRRKRIQRSRTHKGLKRSRS